MGPAPDRTHAAENIAKQLAREYPGQVVEHIEHWPVQKGVGEEEHFDGVRIHADGSPQWWRIPVAEIVARFGPQVIEDEVLRRQVVIEQTGRQILDSETPTSVHLSRLVWLGEQAQEIADQITNMWRENEPLQRELPEEGFHALQNAARLIREGGLDTVLMASELHHRARTGEDSPQPKAAGRGEEQAGAGTDNELNAAARIAGGYPTTDPSQLRTEEARSVTVAVTRAQGAQRDAAPER